MPFGILDTEYIDLPANVDRTYVEGMTLGSGLSFGTVLQSIDERMRAFNTSTDPLIAALAVDTQEAFVEYTQPIAFSVQAAGEYSMGRLQRGEAMGGYMLPVRKWEVTTGWTEDGLREQTLSSINNTVDNILLGYRNKFRKEVMRRLFYTTEVPVEPGKTTATSPGFAGSGTGLDVYDRPFPSGAPLPGGYTHYVRTDAAGLSAALLATRTTLQKQGHAAPYDLIAPQAQIDAITALPDFVRTGSALVRLAPDAEEALVDPNVYLGVFGDVIRVRYAIDDFSSANIAVFKTYGPLDTRNPLAIRFPDRPGLPDGGRSAYLRSRDFFPLAAASVLSSWGVGVNNRTGAVLIHVDAAGSYDNPTITD